MWANINYGYAGRVAGFSQVELLVGAGFGQAASDWKGGEINYGLDSLFDDPADQAAVMIGILLFEKYGLNIDEYAFRDVFSVLSGELRTAREIEGVP